MSGRVTGGTNTTASANTTAVLQLTTGTGETYVYAARSRPMQTTRINLGKGLRARYFKYELEAVDGHDFDLDSIEFLPLVAQRRVN